MACAPSTVPRCSTRTLPLRRYVWVREASQRIVAALDEAGLGAATLPEVGERLQLDRDTMTRALRELSLNRAIVKIERDVALVCRRRGPCT